MTVEMMPVEIQAVYTPDVLARPEWRQLAEAGTRELEKVVTDANANLVRGPDGPLVAEWSLAVNSQSERGHLLALRLTQDGDFSTAVFRPGEVVGDRGQFDMSKAYGRLINLRMQRVIRELTANPISVGRE